jgi:hypothetical protein
MDPEHVLLHVWARTAAVLCDHSLQLATLQVTRSDETFERYKVTLVNTKIRQVMRAPLFTGLTRDQLDSNMHTGSSTALVAKTGPSSTASSPGRPHMLEVTLWAFVTTITAEIDRAGYMNASAYPAGPER